jgi:hypothetical protein
MTNLLLYPEDRGSTFVRNLRVLRHSSGNLSRSVRVSTGRQAHLQGGRDVIWRGPWPPITVHGCLILSPDAVSVGVQREIAVCLRCHSNLLANQSALRSLSDDSKFLRNLSSVTELHGLFCF